MTINFSTWRGGALTGASLPDLPGDVPFKGIMGWDGMVLTDDTVDVVDMTREYAARFKAESCGQCFPCRMGSVELAGILERICAGNGSIHDLDRLEKLAAYVQEASRCDIGQTSPRPILDALTHFRERFVEATADPKPRPRGHYVWQVTAPCIAGCPSRVDIPGYVEKIRNDRFSDAIDLVRQTCCLPGTIGRVCVRNCEAECRRAVVDEAISIKALKRFAADKDVAPRAGNLQPRAGNLQSNDGKPADKVAIVGAGPAGLSCAYYLAMRGYRSTIFEAAREPGGMAAVGIPDYRLPRDVIRAEASRITDLGAEIKYGVKVGEDVTLPGLLAQEYKAVFVGAGAQGSSSMGCEGEDAGYLGFMPGVEFLRRVAWGEKPLDGQTILVVGGGNVAMDCVRSARRLGFDDVRLIYRRTEKEMPADPVEVTESKEEGVQIVTLVAPVRILASDGRVTGLECIRMTLGEPDASGRRKPIPEAGSNFVIYCDAVVPAIGQACEVNKFAPDGVQVSRGNTLVVNPVTLQSTLPSVFGGGDCVTGPSTLVAAIAAGRRAARYIAQYLETGLCAPTFEDYLDQTTALLGQGRKEEAPLFAALTRRAHPYVVDPADRVEDFREVEATLSAAQARREASRCLRCYRIILAAVPVRGSQIA